MGNNGYERDKTAELSTFYTAISKKAVNYMINFEHYRIKHLKKWQYFDYSQMWITMWITARKRKKNVE
ncbi:MAG: hypothetical protein ACOYEC_06185 [Christensenellales bacterium]|jgi:hypothetical protein